MFDIGTQSHPHIRQKVKKETQEEQGVIIH